MDISCYKEKSAVISEVERGGSVFSLPRMDRNQKILNTVGACTANTETDCEQSQMLQIPVEVHLIQFLCLQEEMQRSGKLDLSTVSYLFFLS